MSGSGTGRPFLRIVRSHDDVGIPAPKPTVPMPSRQPMLFSEASNFTLGFIKAGELDAQRLTSLIEQAKPHLIFDLRPAPSFAGGAISRRAIFSLFERCGSEYYDVAGVLGVSARRDALLNPALLIDAIQINILRSGKGLCGPIFFFIDDELFNEEYFSALAERLPHQDGRGWDITCWPNNPTTKPNSERRLIFISHGNPEDNEVAKWMAARLAAEGYQVWTDVTRLIGGELIWDTIEHAIRSQAAKVIVLLSRKGHQKPGLLDEVNVAIATERAEGMERFVLPVRIDELPFAHVRANLARKNIIDGAHNLADAFRKIIKVLKEDEVPKKDIAQLSVDISALDPLSSEDASQWDILLENKVSIARWPNAIRKFRFSGATDALPFICHPVQNGVATFDSWDEISKVFGGQTQRAGEALLSPTDWPSSNELVFSDRGEMRRTLSSLLRQSWDRQCQRLGMLSFPLANRSICWYLKNGALNGNRVRYKDFSGVERSKVLVGQSPRRGVFWHFAVEARPSIADNAVRLIPHILFSHDGVTPISDSAKQHALRRGFCRSWWNARWRDLLSAMLHFLSEGSENIKLPVSLAETINLNAKLTSYNRDIESAVHRFVPGTSSTQLLEFEEPEVAIGYGQQSDYPKEGLVQFGPVDFPRNPTAIRAGVVGTREGVELFQKWSSQFNSYRADPAEGRNSIPFTGFEAIFGATWSAEPVRKIVLSRTDVINSILLQDRHQAVYQTSGLFVDAITRAILNDDLNVDIWYVIIPDEVFLYGRPASRVPRAIAIATPNAMGRSTAKRFTDVSPSLFPEDNEEALIYDHHLDFHHQLKARLLSAKAVTQVLRESSLATVTSAAGDSPILVAPTEPNDEVPDEEFDEFELEELALPSNSVEFAAEEGGQDIFEVSSQLEVDAPAHPILKRRQMQDAATFSWNLATTTFFKAGGRPWRVATARPGVCYIGLIFKKDSAQQGRHACCGAQMFLDDSDGVVFKGAMGPWYSPDTGQFHLDSSEARRLLSMVMTAYEDQSGAPPQEIFIHGRTRFNDEEWSGFCEAVDLSRTKLSAIRITRSNEFKLYSGGELAVKRGTALALGPRLGLLWTSGYIARLGTYPGRETPNPLRIEIVKDSGAGASIESVMRDIMVLTKMNFNSCIYSDGIPVTMRFADAIGDVLVTAKDKEIPPLPFRYYI